MSLRRFQLPYGRDGVFECEVDADRLSVSMTAPNALEDLSESLQQVLDSPIDFPPLNRAIVEGDRVAIVVDQNTPGRNELIGTLWHALESCGVDPANTMITQPTDVEGHSLTDPRGGLPESIRSQVEWHIHRPEDENACAYLATNTTGERVYLSREIVDADFVVCIGAVAFDPSLGYRGTYSSLYPGLSTPDALERSVGVAHAELNPDDSHPLRQIIDEIGWLLGTQFVIQVITAGRAGVAEVFAGLSEPTLSAAKQRLRELWRLDVTERVELVIAAVDLDPDGHSWPQLAAALDTARRIVARDGRILLVTELNDTLTDAIEIIRDARTPRDAVSALQKSATVDRSIAIRIAQALDRANVYLLSGLAPDLVEDLFMIPVASPGEARRVLSGTESCAVIGSAQNVFIRHVEENS